MKKISRQNIKGFTLVETLVAISIFTVSILGLMSVLASGIANTSYAKQKLEAAYLAQEGIEYVRNMRDTYVLYAGNGDWIGFRDAEIDVISPLPPSDANFTRTIEKEVVNSNEVKILSIVEWTQGSGDHNITFSENLFNWVE